MKVVILNTSEKIGGAAIAANRLMKALIKSGVESKMLVNKNQTEDSNVFSCVNDSFIEKNLQFLRFVWERLIIFILNRGNRSLLFRVSIANTGKNIANHPLIKSADIIHLHWINQGFLSLSDIHQLIKTGKPIVWTMHDMWPCTGICHHARECNHYQEQCGQCFFLNSHKNGDISHRIFMKKKQLYNNENIVFVACSNWLANKAKASNLTRTKQIFSIPNPIDTNLFCKKNKSEARKRFNLPLNKHLLLFGALNITDKQKGIDYLIQSLKTLQVEYPEIQKNIELVVFGQVKSEIASLFNVPIHSLGYLSDEQLIVELYNAVDLFVTSSLEENLPNTIMEAMACGTPCVGFNIGGIPEMIDHKKTGYVSRYKDSSDLAEGIRHILDENNLESYGIEARRKVEKQYQQSIVSQQYKEIYQQLISNKHV